MPVNDTFKNKLESLQKAYFKLLPYKVKQLNELWTEMKEHGWSESNFAKFHKLAHNLSSSGGVFGFPKLSESAAELERAIASIESHNLEAYDQKIKDCLRGLEEAAVIHDTSTANAAEPDQPVTTKEEDDVVIQDDREVFWFSKDALYAGECKAQLEYYGIRVRVFSSPHEMLATLEKIKPIALILDTISRTGRMTDPDDLLEHLHEDFAGVPLIFIGPPTQDFSIWISIVRAGGMAYYTKPVNMNSLIEKLDVIKRQHLEEPYRVMIVDDDKFSAYSTAQVLEKGGIQSKAITDSTNVLSNLASFKPDLLLIDFHMPDCDGFELAKIIRLHDEYISIPIVYLSAESKTEAHLEALRLGGDDYILKPVNFNYLYKALAARIKRNRMLRSRMTHDGLTGLSNHSSLLSSLRRELARAGRNKEALALILIDIDRFKKINDTYGHMVGDRVLKTLARFLEGRLRKSDLIGRYGGEELAIVLPNTLITDCMRIIDGIREDFALISHSSDFGSFRVSFSGGVAAFPYFRTATELIWAADQALYKAKKEGRNRIRVSDTASPSEDLIDISHKVDLGPRATIMIIDDEPQITQLIESFLTNADFQVVTCHSGETCYQLLNRIRPELIIIDLLLFPGSKGFELCRSIKDNPDLNHAKIIVLTGNYRKASFEIEASNAGADAFVEKPVDLPGLHSRIESLLGLSHHH